MSIAFNYHKGLFSEPTRGRRGLVIPYLSKVVSTRRIHYVTLYDDKSEEITVHSNCRKFVKKSASRYTNHHPRLT